MQKTQLFASIAEFYDYSMRNNCDYSGWANFVLSKIKQSNPLAKKGLDIACGSGYFTRAFKRAGYDVTGIDISPEMLTSAQNITAKEKLFIPYFVGDMTSLKFKEKVDFITVVNDGINCIPNQKLEKTFKGFATLLKNGGILHFDVSSEFKLKNVIANNTFFEDDEDYSYFWFNTLHEDRVVMEMSVFLREKDKYIKRESILTEYIHPLKTLKETLINNGFEILDINGDMGDYAEISHRIHFTAKRI